MYILFPAKETKIDGNWGAGIRFDGKLRCREKLTLQIGREYAHLANGSDGYKMTAIRSNIYTIKHIKFPFNDSSISQS